MLFSFPKEQIESHPLYIREMGLHLPWWRRGPLPAYISILAFMGMMGIAAMPIKILGVNNPSIAVAVLLGLFYFCIWEHFSAGRLRNAIQSGALSDLNITGQSPVLNVCAYVHAQTRQANIWLAPFFSLVLLYFFFTTMNISQDPAIVMALAIGFLVPFAFVLLVFRARKAASPGIISVGYIRVIQAIWKINPVYEFGSYAAVTAVCTVAFFGPAPVSHMIFLTFPLFAYFQFRWQRPYKKLTYEQWEDLLLRFSQGETPDPGEYLKNG